jgi:hypothetical protein
MSSIENYTNTLVAVGGPSYRCEVLAFLYDCCAGLILLPRGMSCSIRLRDFRFTGFLSANQIRADTSAMPPMQGEIRGN